MRLNQIIAIEKSVKARVHSEISKLHHMSQKPNLYNGLAKSYTPKDDDGEGFPSENVKVQLTVKDTIDDLKSSLSELLNITAKKDYTNCFAKADVVVDGVVILEKVPSTHLLFLEKELIDIRTFVEKLPELDPSESWNEDVNSGLFKTAPYKTHKTKKINKPVVVNTLLINVYDLNHSPLK